jgi:hypothetical protein
MTVLPIRVGQLLLLSSLICHLQVWIRNSGRGVIGLSQTHSAGW